MRVSRQDAWNKYSYVYFTTEVAHLSWILFCTPLLSTQSPQSMTRGSTCWMSLVCDWLFTLSLSLALWSAPCSCPLHSHHHVSLSLSSFHSTAFSFSLLSLSTLNQHPLPPVSSTLSAHYVHSTCDTRFISLHLGERERESGLLCPCSDEYGSKL